MARSQFAGVHPLAEVFPLMEGEAFQALADDIKANGLLNPIVTLDGKILDGRNRYHACNQVGVTPRFDPINPKTNALAYVISANLQRRHLNESQRAMVAARLANLPAHRPKGGRKSENLRTSIAQPEAAKLLRVSTRSITDAKTVQDKVIPAIAARVEAGEVAVSTAAAIASLPKARQNELASASEAELRGAGKKAKRDKKERALAASTAEASANLGSKLYSVIYADPPWRFEPYSRVTGMDRAADNHYPTTTVDDICSITPPAADDCALFLWATAPMLREALAVIDAWGFEYKSHFVWDKETVGTGYWVRSRHELLLIATKGKVPAPAPGDQFESIITAKSAQHSVKPIAFAEMIEEMFPSATLLEMFARDKRAGWDAWGNEAPKTEAA